jgi:hypothetical protein
LNKLRLTGLLLTRLLGLLLMYVSCVQVGYAQQSGGGNYPTGNGVRVREVDGSPNVPGTQTLVFPNGSLTRAGQTVTVTIAGGTTINSTNGQVPYRVNSTTFGDSAFASNALNSTYVQATSGASGAGVALTVAGGGAAEVLKLIPKGNTYVQIGSGGGGGSSDPGLVISRSVDNSNGTGNGHSFVDASVYSRTVGGPNGFNSFDTPVAVGSGGSTYDHYVSFQARPTVSGTWNDIFGGYFVSTFGNNSTVTRSTGLWIAPPTVGTGVTITNNSGIWIDGTTAPGSFNYSLMSTGVSYFMNHAGAVSLGSTTNPSTALHIRGNATRESLLRFTPNVNNTLVGIEWTENGNLSVIGAVKLNPATGEMQHFAAAGGYYQTFYTNGVSRWHINTSGHFLADTDNTYDIGASGANRPRYIYVANFVNAANYVLASNGFYLGTGGSHGALIGSSDGVWRMINSATTSFNRLQFGGTSSSFPAIKRNGAGIDIRLADDSGYAAVNASAFTATGSVIAGAGSALAITSKFTIYSNADGTAALTNAATTDFNRLQFGGTTSSFPALKRSSAALEVRLADDSAYAAHRALTYGVNNACVIRSGAGTPESAVTGNVCDLYLRTDGGANTTLYIKESGTGNTGWIAK